MLGCPAQASEIVTTTKKVPRQESTQVNTTVAASPFFKPFNRPVVPLSACHYVPICPRPSHNSQIPPWLLPLQPGLEVMERPEHCNPWSHGSPLANQLYSLRYSPCYRRPTTISHAVHSHPYHLPPPMQALPLSNPCHRSYASRIHSNWSSFKEVSVKTATVICFFWLLAEHQKWPNTKNWEGTLATKAGKAETNRCLFKQTHS